MINLMPFLIFDGNCDETWRDSPSSQKRFQQPRKVRKLLRKLVGAPGFEPGTSCAQGKRATRLRHAPPSLGNRG